MRPKWKFLGILTFLVPVLIMTYYAVIGGWITKYAVVYLTGNASAAAEDGYFTSFITSPVSPVVFALLFMGVTAFIVYNGVQDGIERVSRYMMPVLLVLVVIIAGYSLTLRHEDASGQLRTGLEGLRYYLTPHMEGLTVSRFLQILLDAMSQLFFSLSVSMGIMITYGSYVKPEVDLNKAVNQIEIFDTGVALLAGAMIIPAVYVFSGTEGMSAGPSPLFVSLPKVFAAMGKAGGFGWHHRQRIWSQHCKRFIEHYISLQSGLQLQHGLVFRFEWRKTVDIPCDLHRHPGSRHLHRRRICSSGLPCTAGVRCKDRCALGKGSEPQGPWTAVYRRCRKAHVLLCAALHSP